MTRRDRSKVWGTVIAVAAAVLLGTTVTPTAHTDDGIPFETDPLVECLGAVPHLPADPLGGPITVEIALALDGVEETEAVRMLNRAEAPYRPDLDAAYPSPDVRFEIIDVRDVSEVLSDETEVGAFYTEPQPDGDDLMAQLMRHYNDLALERDHVHLATSRDITSGGEAAVAGIANCIGSIGLPELSYSIGEVGTIDPVELGLTFLSDADAAIASHEIGHAFGAHHHYANCAENAVPAVAQGSGGVCTLMFNDVSLVGMRFSAVSTGATRGYAETHLEGGGLLP